MNPIRTALSAAVLAASMVGVAAYAADTTSPNEVPTDKADAKKVVPSHEALEPGAAPDIDTMDANAQRQHDRDRDGAGKSNAADHEMGTAAATTSTADPKTRDWAAVDTNNDNLIQPEEMEEALKPVGPQAKKQKQ